MTVKPKIKRSFILIFKHILKSLNPKISVLTSYGLVYEAIIVAINACTVDSTFHTLLGTGTVLVAASIIFASTSLSFSNYFSYERKIVLTFICSL